MAKLKRMQHIATGLLILMAVIFAISFALQARYPWLQFVRAASEGGMVGAIADWFAVTAIFRHPLGVKIPHTAIIPNRKDELGASLGDFVEENFLSETVIRARLQSFSVAKRLGPWLASPERARRVTAEASVASLGVLAMLSDDSVQQAIEATARTQLLDPQWGPTLGRFGEQLFAAGHHQIALDLVLDRADEWMAAHPLAFSGVVSKGLPTWVPSIVDRLVDDRVYREARRFVAEVRTDPDHPLRALLDDYLTELAGKLQDDGETIDKVEALKSRMFDDPQVSELAARVWDIVKGTLLVALGDENSNLRSRIQGLVIDLGTRLTDDEGLAGKIDAWVADGAAYLVRNYRHDIASIITDTVKRWDPQETTDKIEALVGKDLQFIRINGTIVGSLAGMAIYILATAFLGG
ncbi:MAG: DUF445 domain-containing protein [Terrimesophilobacter sp.]